MSFEVTTVTDHSVTVHDGDRVIHLSDLEPNTEVEIEGLSTRTLNRPGTELLSTVCTVNDVHFGEREVGNLSGDPDFTGVVLSSDDDETPYVDQMNADAVTEMRAQKADAYIVKGDLTCHGTTSEYQEFLDCYERLGDKLTYVRGNHDGYAGETFAATPHQAVLVPGLLLAVLDTVLPGKTPGRLLDDQLDWLDSLAAKSDRPVLVLGHHPAAWHSEDDFNLDQRSSNALVDIIDRRNAIIGYAAGHTHRNQVKHTPAGVPLIEVASVKDYPGGWTSYRVFDEGVVQSFHRVSTPAALAWTNRTRQLFEGHYPEYSFGALHDRCLVLPTR